MREEGRIVLCGVGGQGLIAAGRVVGLALLEEGFSVRVAEVHGLAQRGGSVVVHVKFSRSPDLAPTIPEGGADAVIALEIIEALRAVKFLKARKGIMLVNDFILPPPGASRTLPRNQVLTALKKVNAKLVIIIKGFVIVIKRVFTPVPSDVFWLPAALKEWGVPLREKPTSEFIAPLRKEISGMIVKDQKGEIKAIPVPFTEQSILIDEKGRPIEMWLSEGRSIRGEIGEVVRGITENASLFFIKKYSFDKLIKQMKANKYTPIARYRSHPLDDKYLLHPGLLPLQSIPEIIFSPTGERVRIFVFIKKYQNRQMELHEKFRDIRNKARQKKQDIFERMEDRELSLIHI